MDEESTLATYLYLGDKPSYATILLKRKDHIHTQAPLAVSLKQFQQGFQNILMQASNLAKVGDSEKGSKGNYFDNSNQ